MNLEEQLKIEPYLTTYNKDYIQKKILCSGHDHFIKQEFADPLCEGFKNYLILEKEEAKLSSSSQETCDAYLEKVKKAHPKLGKLYLEEPVDHIAIKSEQLLNGKSNYQVDYCDIEKEIKRKLLAKEDQKVTLPEGWNIPLTTQNYDFRPPLLQSKYAMNPVFKFKYPDNLGQNEKINQILNVQIGDSEYVGVIGALGKRIVKEEMHGKIIDPTD